MISDRNIKADSALAFIIIFTAIIFVGFFRVAYPYLDHWANFSDADSLIAAKNFVKFGFINCYFLPNFDPQLTSPGAFYLHYPPLPQIFYGLLLKLLGTFSNPVVTFRIITLIFSGLACWFWYLFLRNLTFSSFISLAGLLFYITNPLFILNADSLSPYSFQELFRSSILFYFVVFLQDKRKPALFLLLALLFLNILTSFEYVIYAFLFMGLYCLFFRKKLAAKYWFIMLSVVAFGFLIHLIQNAFVLGGLKAAFTDIFISAKARINSSVELGYARPSFGYWLQACFIRNIALAINGKFKFLIISIIVIILFIIEKKIKNEEAKDVVYCFKLFIILFICGLSWWILFPSHSIVHIYTATHMLLAFALLISLFFYLLIRLGRDNHFLRNKITLKIIIITGMIFLSIQNILNSDLPVTKSNKMSKVLFINYSKILSELGCKLEKDEYIISNYWNVQVMEHYSDRNCRYITTLEELKKQALKHRYFLYFPGEGELFNYLKSNYRVVGEYMAQNIPRRSIMPFIIFEKVIK